MLHVPLKFKYTWRLSWLVLLTVLCCYSCKQSDPPLAPIELQFETSELGFAADQDSVEVHLTLSRAAEQEGNIQLNIQEKGVQYGAAYQTKPEANNGQLQIPVHVGERTLTFIIKKKADLLLEGAESVRFAIKSPPNAMALGATDFVEVRFAAIVSTGSQLKINGGPGGSAAENTVFIDLSANSQTARNRLSWDLGFINGDGFSVLLNNTLPDAMAVQINKNDLTKVGPADTVGLQLNSSFSPADLKKVDDYLGDLTKTVIAPVEADPSANKVYILNRGEAAAHTSDDRDWMKIRIIQKGDGYDLQYAKIAATSFQTVHVSKSNSHWANYVSLTSGEQVQVMPAKAKWDIQWGVGSYITTAENATIYYPFSDLVFINNADGVQAAAVKTTSHTYEAFSDADIAELQFSDARDAIGASWRATQGAVIGVYTDRFYVIKDPAGNIYKLKFLNFTAQDGGSRGYPNIAYQLVRTAQKK